MPDNTLKIAELRAQLQAAVRATSTPDISVQIDLDTKQRQLDALIADDDTLGNRRPTACGMNLGSF